MKCKSFFFLAGVLVCGSSLTLAQQTPSAGPAGQSQKKTSSASIQGVDQADIDKAIANLGDTLRELSILDESDKKLAQSNQTQADTTAMLDRAENKIRHQDVPALEMRGDEWDRKRQQLINSGCPSESGMADRATAERCNPQIRALNAEHVQIEADAQSLKDQAASIQKTREAVSQTILANVRQQKDNNARRNELLATKKLEESTLLELKKKSDSCQNLLRQRDVTCEKIKLRCGMVQFDGSDPDLPPSSKDTACGRG